MQILNKKKIIGIKRGTIKAFEIIKKTYHVPATYLNLV